MKLTKVEKETGLIDLSETPDDEKVVLKLMPGYTFHHPNGTKLQRRFEDRKTGVSVVLMYDAAGGATRVPGDSPFIAVPARAVKGQEVKFARPTSEELEMLSKKGQKNMTPPAAAEPMTSLGVPLENKQLGVVPDKEVKRSEAPPAKDLEEKKPGKE